MKLYIRNMVCNRCKMVMKSELIKFGLHPVSVELGDIEVEEELSESQKTEFNGIIKTLGFELIDDKKSRIITKIKTIILELLESQNQLAVNLSDHLSSLLNHDYSYISNLFSDVEGTTIEQYYISQKIEKVKEYLVYDEQTLSEIAYSLNYSSVAHLSRQFKKVTGFTPSHFKALKEKKRKSLDEL